MRRTVRCAHGFAMNLCIHRNCDHFDGAIGWRAVSQAGARGRRLRKTTTTTERQVELEAQPRRAS